MVQKKGSTNEEAPLSDKDNATVHTVVCGNRIICNNTLRLPDWELWIKQTDMFLGNRIRIRLVFSNVIWSVHQKNTNKHKKESTINL